MSPSILSGLLFREMHRAQTNSRSPLCKITLPIVWIGRSLSESGCTASLTTNDNDTDCAIKSSDLVLDNSVLLPDKSGSDSLPHVIVATITNTPIEIFICQYTFF